MKTSWLALAVISVLAVSLPVVSFAQTEARATLTGNLTDPSGAAIPNVTINAIKYEEPQKNKNVAAKTQSDAAGHFSLTLAPGRYRIVVSAPSFARTEEIVTLVAGESRELNAKLALEKLAASVVVTAAAEPTLGTDSSAPVDVVTKDDIAQLDAMWLAPVIASESGAALSRLGPEGGVTTYFLDGGDSNFTKFLVDGIPMNEPGGAIELENYSLQSVDKIEIVHGASSALFGSDAVDGVVQIFSHRGTTTAPELELTGEGGTFGTGLGNVQLSGVAGRFDYSASGGYFATGGQGPNDYFRDVPFAGNFGWKFSDTDTLRLTVREAESDGGVPGQTIFLPPSLTDHDDLHNLAAGITWDFMAGDHWQNELRATDARIQEAYINSFGNSYNLYNRANFEDQATYLFPHGGVSAGYMYEVENGAEGGPDSRRNNQAGYVEVRYQFGRRVTATAGGRAEANASFGTRVVPRAGIAYALRYGHDFWGATRLRVSYGEGIKEPDFFDSFSNDPCDPGNPNLMPEQSTTIHGGADQVLASDRFRISVDYFHNDFTDIVSFASLPPTTACPYGTGQFFNTDKARAFGANSKFETKVTRWLHISGNYTYDDTLVIASPNYYDPTLAPGNRLAKRPLHSATLIANANFHRMNWNLAGYYVGRRTDSDYLGLGITSNPSYVRWDLGTSYHFTRKLSALGRVENLFDRRYQDAVGYPALGLNWRLGMKYVWGGE
ncbi:MAG: TonB-dependent receptor [Candidatus Acidiferrales bacterium]|jgi:vitamin B12 transporter